MRTSLTGRLQTSSAQITKVYGLLLLGLMVAMSLSVTTLVGINALHNTHQQAHNVLKGLRDTYVLNRDDWYWWRVGSPVNSHSTFIRASTEAPQKDSVSTRHTTDFVKKTADAKRIFGDLYFSQGAGFYYYMTTTQKVQDGKQTVAAKYQLWMSLTNAVNLLLTLLRIISGLMLLFFLLGTGFIYGLAKRLNRPLVNLTQYTKVLNDNNWSQAVDSLPVPTKPTEVRELSIEFNQLLHSINQQAENDRQFVSNVSHELKTPIAAIRGHVELIQRHGKRDPKMVPDALTVIDRESLRMQRMIESLLNLSHASQLTIDRQPTDLVPLVAKVVGDYQRQIAQDIMLVADDSVRRRVNSATVEQIFLALLNNAGKYSPPTGIITVRVTNKEISVSDVGPGIRNGDKARVFERFYRGSQTGANSTVKGTGLGLAIVKQLVALNHGDIQILDNQPTGSRFLMHFPTDS